MTNEKLTKTIVEEILNGNAKNEEVKMMIEDLTMKIEEDDTIFRNGSFTLEVKNNKTVVLSTTYSNQEINEKFIEEMTALNILKNELNKY